MGLLLWWFVAVTLLHDVVYGFHSRMFALSVEKFDEIHYTGIAFFKVIWFFFNVIPYFALVIVT
jgi:hypothetical protein